MCIPPSPLSCSLSNRCQSGNQSCATLQSRALQLGPLTQCPHNNLALNSFMAAAVLFMVLREHINSAVRRPRGVVLSATLFSSASLYFNPSPILSTRGGETCGGLRMSVGKKGADVMPARHAAPRRLSSWRSDGQMDSFNQRNLSL